jgi:acyl-CoA synthetase (NDP forming)
VRISVGSKPAIAKLFSPRGVAVIGAAPQGQGLRGRILETLRAHPYAGSIHPVSRTNAEVQGLKAYATIGEVPRPVDSSSRSYAGVARPVSAPRSC